MTLEEAAEPFAGQRTLITGGVGFIGSTLARALARAGAIVTVIDSLVPEYGGNLANLEGIADQVRINISDIRDRYSLPFLVRGQDVVFNLAGQTSHLDSMTDPFTDLEINCRAQLSILEACRHHNPDSKVIFASTRQIYGRPQYLPVDERHPLSPVDVNGINKTAGEWYHLLYGDVYGLPVTVLRLTNTYGPRMRVRDARQTFLGYWFRQVLNGEELAVFGGTQKRDFNYVDDVVAAFLVAALSSDTNGQVYNLGSSEVVTLTELATTVIRVAGTGTYRVVPFPEDRKAIDIGDYYADCASIRAAIGWSPAIGLDDGIARSLEFYRTYGGQYWGE